MTRFRFFRRGAAFSWIVIGMLALGVGGTTAMFSIVNGVLLQPLDLPDPGQLVLVGERVPQVPGSEKFLYFDTPSAFFAWRRQASDFSGMSAIQGSSFTLTGAGRPLLVHGARVSSNFFDVVGVRAELGRVFVTADETDTSHPMVITDALWRAAFNADRDAIGRSVGSGSRQATIVGVLPPAFRLGGSELGPMLAGTPTEYFMPLHFGPGSGGNLTSVFSNFNYTVIGRLRPGVTREHALAQLNVIQADLARSAPEHLSLYAELTTVRDYAVAESRQALWLLLAGIVAVLLIVCVNLGGLWTTRLADRRRDWAIRIGARRRAGTPRPGDPDREHDAGAHWRRSRGRHGRRGAARNRGARAAWYSPARRRADGLARPGVRRGAGRCRRPGDRRGSGARPEPLGSSAFAQGRRLGRHDRPLEPALAQDADRPAGRAVDPAPGGDRTSGTQLLPPGDAPYGVFNRADVRGRHRHQHAYGRAARPPAR